MSGRKIVETRTVNRKHEKHAGRAVCMFERERESVAVESFER